jgi:RNA polymerase primary sigma factor
MSDQLLTAADEIRLARRIERGDMAAKDQMIVGNLRLVHALAARHRGRGVPIEDLVQEGTIGLIRAVERFDHRRGLKFSTYAVWWIRRSLSDAVGDARTIRIPSGAQRQLAAVQRAEAELRQAGAGDTTNEAIARRAGLDTRTVKHLRAAPRVSASLDAPVGEALAPLGELVADASEPDVSRQVEERESRRELRSTVRLLPERHRQVLVDRYGLLGDRSRSHEEIGASLGVSKERSRQLERQALHRLRELRDRVPRAA